MDYTPVFNKLTRDSLLKFLEINELQKDVRKGTTKQDLEKGLLDFFTKEPEWEIEFQKFYINTEEAGRKHFFMYAADIDRESLSNIDVQLKTYIPESKRSFNPLEDNGKIYYQRDENFILIKRISIKKCYNLIKGDEQDDHLVRTYGIKIIHFIEYVKIFLKKKVVICGYDAYGDLIEKRKFEADLNGFLKSLLGPKTFTSLSSIITSEKIERLRHQPNCIVSSLSNRIKILDQATFKKSRANIDKILSDIKRRKYKIDEIKDNNPDLDVQTNPLLEASIEKSIATDLDLKNSGVELYYFTNKSGIINALRIRIDLSRDLIITFSDSITKEELGDVFAKLN